MSGEHVDPVTLARLFEGRGGGPLGVEEFDSLHRHLASCPGCRGEFERQRARNLRPDDALTKGQVATILNVALERGRRLESDARAPSAEAHRAASNAPRPRWARPVAWGLGGALAAACAALLLFPASGWHRGEWTMKGGSEASASRDLFCFDPVAESADPITGPRPRCPVGRRVSVQARSIRDFQWISVVGCDEDGCKLVDAQPSATPTVSLFGPAMEADRSLTVFTVWSVSAILQQDLDVAVAAIRARGGKPNAVDWLPLERANKQLATAVSAAGPPS